MELLSSSNLNPLKPALLASSKVDVILSADCSIADRGLRISCEVLNIGGYYVVWDRAVHRSTMLQSILKPLLFVLVANCIYKLTQLAVLRRVQTDNVKKYKTYMSIKFSLWRLASVTSLSLSSLRL